MTKITFNNNSSPAINAANLNQIQTNVENAIDTVQTNLNTTNSNVTTLENRVTNAETQLNKVNEWTLVGQATGYTAISLSGITYNTLLAVFSVQHPNNYPLYGTIVIPKDVVSDTQYRYFDTGSTRTYFRCFVVGSGVGINTVQLEGQSFETSTTLRVYYQ